MTAKPWKESELDEMRELRSQGFSYGAIAKELSLRHGRTFTRSATIAADHRHNGANPRIKTVHTLRNPGSPQVVRKPVKIAQQRKRPRPCSVKGERQPAIPPVKFEVAAPAAAKPTRLVDIRSDQCRWPLSESTDAAEFFYCGATVDGASVYCAYHHCLGIIPRRSDQATAP